MSDTPVESMTHLQKIIKGLIEEGCNIIGDDTYYKDTDISKFILFKIAQEKKGKWLELVCALDGSLNGINESDGVCDNALNYNSLTHCGCRIGNRCFLFTQDSGTSYDDVIENFRGEKGNESCDFYLIRFDGEGHYFLEVYETGKEQYVVDSLQFRRSENIGKYQEYIEGLAKKEVKTGLLVDNYNNNCVFEVLFDSLLVSGIIEEKELQEFVDTTKSDVLKDDAREKIKVLKVREFLHKYFFEKIQNTAKPVEVMSDCLQGFISDIANKHPDFVNKLKFVQAIQHGGIELELQNDDGKQKTKLKVFLFNGQYYAIFKGKDDTQRTIKKVNVGEKTEFVSLGEDVEENCQDLLEIADDELVNSVEVYDYLTADARKIKDSDEFNRGNSGTASMGTGELEITKEIIESKCNSGFINNLKTASLEKFSELFVNNKVAVTKVFEYINDKAKTEENLKGLKEFCKEYFDFVKEHKSADTLKKTNSYIILKHTKEVLDEKLKTKGTVKAVEEEKPETEGVEVPTVEEPKGDEGTKGTEAATKGREPEEASEALEPASAPAPASKSPAPVSSENIELTQEDKKEIVDKISKNIIDDPAYKDNHNSLTCDWKVENDCDFEMTITNNKEVGNAERYKVIGVLPENMTIHRLLLKIPEVGLNNIISDCKGKLYKLIDAGNGTFVEEEVVMNGIEKSDPIYEALEFKELPSRELDAVVHTVWH